jgi:selenocysteine-specific translation elongation factor
MIYLLLSRSITWPFGFNSNNKKISILDDEYQKKINLDESSPLISNKDLVVNSNLSKNMDQTRSLIDTNRISNLPPPNVLSVLGKHYLTREDLENMIQTRFKQETSRDRIERFLWKE